MGTSVSCHRSFNSKCICVLYIHSTYLIHDFFRLVDDLGLKSTLSEYNVPKDDLPKIAQLALGDNNDPLVRNVTAVLQGIY